jgi:hypothetical protein
MWNFVSSVTTKFRLVPGTKLIHRNEKETRLYVTRTSAAQFLLFLISFLFLSLILLSSARLGRCLLHRDVFVIYTQMIRSA